MRTLWCQRYHVRLVSPPYLSSFPSFPLSFSPDHPIIYSARPTSSHLLPYPICSFDLTASQRSRLAGAHFRWRDGSVTSRGKIMKDDVIDHLGGSGAFATARDFASVLLLFINEGRHRKSCPLLTFLCLRILLPSDISIIVFEQL